jgi:hypothetical protein
MITGGDGCGQCCGGLNRSTFGFDGFKLRFGEMENAAGEAASCPSRLFVMEWVEFGPCGSPFFVYHVGYKL